MLWEIHKTAGSELLVEAAGVTRGHGEVFTLEEEFFIYSFIFFSLYLTTLVPFRSSFVCFYKETQQIQAATQSFTSIFKKTQQKWTEKQNVTFKDLFVRKVDFLVSLPTPQKLMPWGGGSINL